MAVIVLHVGMPKAGSSSVQQWLRREAAALRERGFTVVFAPRNEQGSIEFVPYERGPINSGWIVDRGVRLSSAERRAGVDVLVRALASAADRHGSLILTGESFAHPFWALHADTLAALQRLSHLHEVRVAYFARPQHTSLEAAWRQWGYRSGMRPSAFVAERAARLHYAATRRGVRALAPGLDFEPAPFREDMGPDYDVAADFAWRFLGLEVGSSGERANTGLPLPVVNLLAAAPAGLFWDPSYGDARIDRIKRLLADHPLPEDDKIALSRQVLRKFSHEAFAAENTELGWQGFVPPPDDPQGTPGLDALDELWRPQASPAELRLVVTALQAAI